MVSRPFGGFIMALILGAFLNGMLFKSLIYSLIFYGSGVLFLTLEIMRRDLKVEFITGAIIIFACLCFFLVSVKWFFGFSPPSYFLLNLLGSLFFARFLFFSHYVYSPSLRFFTVLAYFFSFGFFYFFGSLDQLYAGSRNHVSVFSLALTALVLSLRIFSGFREVYVILCLNFLLCFYAGGASGIIVSAFLLLFSPLVFSRYTTFIFQCIVMAGVSFSVIEFFDISREMLLKFDVNRLLSGDVRYQIIQSYFQQYFRGFFIFLGSPDSYEFSVVNRFNLSGDALEVEVATLHNSYLALHSKAGFNSLIFCYLVIKSSHLLWKNDRLAFLMFMGLLVRAFSDQVFLLDGYYNFVFIYFLYAGFNFRSKRWKNQYL